MQWNNTAAGAATPGTQRPAARSGRHPCIHAPAINQLLARWRGTDGSDCADRRHDLARLTIDVVRDSVPDGQTSTWATTVAEPGSPDYCGCWGNPRCSKELVRNRWTTPSTTRRPAMQSGVVTARVLSRHVWPGADAAGGRLQAGGIAQAERDVFSPSLPGAGYRADGSGLGPAIVQEIARQHGIPDRNGRRPSGQ